MERECTESVISAAGMFGGVFAPQWASAEMRGGHFDTKDTKIHEGREEELVCPDVARAHVRTCSGRNPRPISRAGSRRRRGTSCNRRIGSGGLSVRCVARTRLTMRFWNST